MLLPPPCTATAAAGDQMGNKGGVVQLNPQCKPSFLTFTAVPHPPVRPMAYSSGMGSMFGL